MPSTKDTVWQKAEHVVEGKHIPTPAAGGARPQEAHGRGGEQRNGESEGKATGKQKRTDDPRQGTVNK